MVDIWNWLEKLYTTGNGSNIFSSEPFFLKPGISSEYVMVDFIHMGLLDLWGARNPMGNTK